MNEFVLPLTKDLLKYHTRWNERSLKPYTDELFDLWAENSVDGLLDTQLQGPTLTRFGIIPDDRRRADRIVGHDGRGSGGEQHVRAAVRGDNVREAFDERAFLPDA